MVDQVLGRIAVVARGAYDPKVEYERLDAVTYNGSTYLVRQRCRGVTPAEGTFYMLMAQAGDSSAANAAAAEALRAAEGADAAKTTAEIAASAANAAAVSAQSVVDTVVPDVTQLKNGKCNIKRLIASVEITELVSALYINKDTDGNAFDLSEVIIIGVAPASTNADATNGYISVKGDGVASYSGMFGAINLKSTAGETCWFCNIITNPGAPTFAEIASAVRPVNATLINKQVSFGNTVRYFSNINSIVIYPNGKIEPRTIVYVFGVDRI